MSDLRLAALVKAVNAERIAGFPSGRLFLDSRRLLPHWSMPIEVRAARCDRCEADSVPHARERLKIKGFVQAKVEDDLTLIEMAQAVELSPAHFSRMFRESTGETPHQFVLRNRIERAKEMLRVAEASVLDVAVARGFKTQQHFARVFRQIYGASPTEYRYEVVR
jgi:AraC family transcriptional regulator